MKNNNDLSKFQQKRIPSIVFGMVLFIFLGLMYAWSIFVTPIEQEFGWLRSDTSNVFSVTITAFCFGCIAGSKLLSKISPRLLIRCAAVLVCVGLVLTSTVTKLPVLYCTYGVFCGFGVGFMYNVALTTIPKWFPDMLGKATGLLLMCYGLGSMILSTASSVMIQTMGWRTTFKIIGIAFGVIACICAQWVFPPSEEQREYIIRSKTVKTEQTNRKTVEDVQGLDLSSREMFKRKSWWFYLTWCILVTAAFLGLIGHAATLSLEIKDSTAIATFITGSITVANGVARLIAGALYDRMPIRKMMMSISVIFVVAPALLYLATRIDSIPVLAVGGALLGMAYGGVATTNAFFVRKFYGDTHYAENFGILNFSGIIATVMGSTVGGIMQVHFGSYTPVMFYFLILSGIAFIANLFVKRP